jgi:hypothetical protein
LHDEEIWVVDIQLDGLEEILNCMLLRSVSVDEIFRRPAQHDLSCYRDLRILFKADWRFQFIAVIEYDCDARFRDSGLATLVNEILYIALSALIPFLRSQSALFTWRLVARTVLMFVIPRTKHIESKIFDFPLPLRPVIELKLSSLGWCQLVVYRMEEGCRAPS